MLSFRRDQVRLFIQNLQPKYFEPLKLLAITNYKRVYSIRRLIRDDLPEDRVAKKCEVSTQSNVVTKEPTQPATQCNAITKELAQPAIQSDTITKEPVQPKQFTPLGMSYTEALESLWRQGVLRLESPRPDPPPIERTIT